MDAWKVDCLEGSWVERWEFELAALSDCCLVEWLVVSSVETRKPGLVLSMVGSKVECLELLLELGLVEQKEKN